MSKWQTEYFFSGSGNSPVYEFTESLDMKVRSKIKNTLWLLKDYGPSLGPPHSKKLTGTKLWELRILGQNNIRIFYTPLPDQKLLLLHGFVKKSEKTPPQEIETALKRLLQYHKIAIK